MIYSMTGFGEARLEDAQHAYHLELRTVNNRYLKTSIYLPDDLAFLEGEVERLIRQRITRGSVSLRLHVRDISPNAAAEINGSVVQTYLRQLQQIAGSAGGLTIDLATLLTLPGACQPHEPSAAEREQKWAVLQRLAEEALGKLVTMRATEGKSLAADLMLHCSRLRKSLGVVRERVPAVIEEYRDRLKARVEELIKTANVQLAENDLLKEVSIYAERSDISEEISRLAAHVDQFVAFMESDEPPGRKLEFVAQEMLREANTMGAKTGDAAISREIIEMKAAVDRIKEQIQNCE